MSVIKFNRPLKLLSSRFCGNSKITERFGLFQARNNSSYNNSHSKYQIKEERNNSIEKYEIDKDYVKVYWANSSSHISYPIKLLRDMCRCAQCFQPTSNQRSFTFGDLSEKDFKIETINFDNENRTLSVDWCSAESSDNHKGVILYEQLKKLYTNKKYLGSNILIENRNLWLDSTLKIPTVEFDAVLSSNSGYLEWVDNLIKYGFCTIKNTPTQLESIFKLADRVSFFKKTNYGETFKVQSKNDPSNIAYTNHYIPPHIDLPYWDYAPQVQILHCLIQSTDGGESTLVDGVACAYKLRETDPEAFQVLSNSLCLYENIGSDEYGKYYLQKATPLIVFDKETNTVVNIREGNFQRTHFIGSAEEIKKAYDAYPKFYRLLADPKNRIKFTMEPGDLLCFDNCRILHGRESFSSNQERLLHGGYFDWDQLLSKARSLKME